MAEMILNYYPLSDMRLVGTIKQWNKFAWPVFETNQVTNKDEADNFCRRATSGLYTGYDYYGNEGEVLDIESVPGTLKTFLAESIILGQSFSDTTKEEEVVLSDTYSVNIIRTSSTGNYNTGTVYIKDPFTTQKLQECHYVKYESNGTVGIDSFLSNGAAGAFIRFSDQGQYKYIRVVARMYFSFDYRTTEHPFYIDVGSKLIASRAVEFFGCKAYTIVSLSDMTNDSEFNEITTDPFEPGGSGGTGGGGGDFDNTSTPVDIPNLPIISAVSTGFISLYNPSLSQLNELSSYLWSDLFEIDGWKKLFANPMDSILGLSILPVPVPSGGTREVKVGNIGTGISLTVASSQFVEVDCGTINVNEYWGAYLDYEPYTQAQIFLPYIGTRPISVDEIMGKTVRVVYHVDILTGACCCFVKCGDSVLYTYNGQCSIPIPITGANYTSVVNGILTIAGSAAALVASGGITATMAAPTLAGVAGAGSAVMGAAQTAVNQMKPQISKSGPLSGAAGILNMQIPYLILIRPRQALPSKQNEFIGYPSVITVQLTELTGYTEVQSIHLENIPATQEELAEIQSLLMGGVIF